MDLLLPKAMPFINTLHSFIKNIVTLRTLTILLLLLGLPAIGSAAEPPVPSYTLKLVKKLVDPQAVSEFDCRDRVYLMTTWFQVYGKHRITALWFNPEGALQDQGHLDFVGEQKETDGWLALEFLNVETQAASTHLNAEVARFYGKWKVQVLLDNNFLEGAGIFCPVQMSEAGNQSESDSLNESEKRSFILPRSFLFL